MQVPSAIHCLTDLPVFAEKKIRSALMSSGKEIDASVRIEVLCRELVSELPESLVLLGPHLSLGESRYVLSSVGKNEPHSYLPEEFVWILLLELLNLGKKNLRIVRILVHRLRHCVVDLLPCALVESHVSEDLVVVENELAEILRSLLLSSDCILALLLRIVKKVLVVLLVRVAQTLERILRVIKV